MAFGHWQTETSKPLATILGLIKTLLGVSGAISPATATSTSPVVALTPPSAVAFPSAAASSTAVAASASGSSRFVVVSAVVLGSFATRVAIGPSGWVEVVPPRTSLRMASSSAIKTGFRWLSDCSDRPIRADAAAASHVRVRE